MNKKISGAKHPKNGGTKRAFRRFYCPGMSNAVKVFPKCQKSGKALFFQRLRNNFSLKTTKKQLTFHLKSC